MNHKENYSKLRKTLSSIETKGGNTLIMAECLRFLAHCINECEQAENHEAQTIDSP